MDRSIQAPRPSPSPGACSNSCPSSQWCHPTTSPSVSLFSCGNPLREPLVIRQGSWCESRGPSKGPGLASLEAPSLTYEEPRGAPFLPFIFWRSWLLFFSPWGCRESDTTERLTLTHFKKKVFIFKWRIIALQSCVGACHPSAWVGHRCTCPLRLEPPSRLSPHPTLRAPTEPQAEVPASDSNFPRLIPLTCGGGCASTPLMQFVPPSPSRTVSTGLFSVTASPLLPCK